MSSIINFLIIFVLIFPPSTGQSSTNPFLLTDGKNGEKIIEYNASKKCFSNGTDEAKKPLGLTFRLPQAGGYCDNGLLICYLSHLQNKSDNVSFRLKRTFRIDDGKENKITKECAEKMEKDGISVGTNHWHGIKVQTKLTNGPKGKQMRNTELETSFDDHIFNVGLNRRQFSIHFGDNLNDSVIILEPSNNDESLFADQRTLQNQFLNDVPNGEFLGEFTGLWLLGLDMVPLPASQQNVQLYINRGCECAMEAWFIQPTDSAEPTDPNVPTVGSNSCPKLSTDLLFPFKITEMSSSFSITTLTDPNIKSLTVELLDENKKAVELSYKLGTDNDLEVTLPGEEEEPIVVEGTRLAKGAYVLHLEIVQNYYFLFKINGTQFGIKYWPKEWMKHNQTKWIKVQSQLLLLQDPIVKQNEKEVITVALKEMLNYGQKIVIDTGKLSSIKSGRLEGTPFIVKLMHNSPESSKYDILAQMNFKSDDNMSVPKKIFKCIYSLNKEGNELQQSAEIKMKYFASFVKLKLEILMLREGFYARSLTAPGAYTKLCPYYLPKNAKLTTKPSPPWAIDHVQVIFGDVPTNATKISVEDEQDTTVDVLEEDRTHKKYPLRKINYTKIYLKNTSTNPFKPIIVNIFMRGPFNPDAEMRINLFNRALEFHELFGTTVLMLKVRKTWAALNSFKDGKWLGPWQNDTLTIPKDIDHIHNDAPDNDDEPDIFFYIMQQDRQGKEIEIQILSKYDESVQSFSYPTKVPINGIQYLTVEYENVVFDYEVEQPRQNSVER